jgi:TonB-dependent SusC/RagA subfamily outer membrane receptor
MRTAIPVTQRQRHSDSAVAAILLIGTLTACGGAARKGSDPAGDGRRAATVESANSLDESMMDQQAVGRVEELFIGRFPGVQVFNVNGQVQLRIRGASSVSGSTEPLILVDGQQITQGSGGLIGLNPRDIHKIEVLKDAVSMAEYGLRGSNGVIRITTKRR